MWRWLDPRGRAGVTEFWRIGGVCLLLASPFLTLLALDGIDHRLRLAAVGVLWLVMAVVWLAAIRRVHDQGDAGAWVFFAMGGPTLLLLTWVTLPALGIFIPGGGLALLLFVGGCLTYAGHYGLTQGDGSQPNRFGPPTLRPTSEGDERRYRQMLKSGKRRAETNATG